MLEAITDDNKQAQPAAQNGTSASHVSNAQHCTEVLNCALPSLPQYTDFNLCNSSYEAMQLDAYVYTEAKSILLQF